MTQIPVDDSNPRCLLLKGRAFLKKKITAGFFFVFDFYLFVRKKE